MGKCTILVNSCDSYSDTWYPFFTLFQKYWPDCPYEIVLNTESKTYEHEGLSIKCPQYYTPDEKPTYGARLLRCLRDIDAEYILLLMDDFFIRRPVDQKRIEFLIHEMDENSNIAVFSFDPVWRPEQNSCDVDDHKYDDFILRKETDECKFNLQAAIWRKDALISLIGKQDYNAWRTERNGTFRSYFMKKRFYAVREEKQLPIYYGAQPTAAFGICFGKWVIDDVKELFDQNGIEVNYVNRGGGRRKTKWLLNAPAYLRTRRQGLNRCCRTLKNWVQRSAWTCYCGRPLHS